MKVKGRFHAMLLERDPYSILNRNKLEASYESARSCSSCISGHHVLISWHVKKKMQKDEDGTHLFSFPKRKLHIPVWFDLVPAMPLQRESFKAEYAFTGYFHFDAGYLKDLKILDMDSIAYFCRTMMKNCGPIFKYHSIIPYDRYVNDSRMEELKETYRRIIPNGDDDEFIEELLLMGRNSLVDEEDWIIRRAEAMIQRAERRRDRNEMREGMEE